MDQLTILAHNHELSNIFNTQYKKYQNLIIILQNDSTLILLCSFLDTAQLLKLSSTNKSIKNTIDKHISIQNRILKSKILYLTQLQQRKLQNSKLNSNPLLYSACSAMQSYWSMATLTLEERIHKMKYDGKTLAASPIAVVLRLRQMQKRKRIRMNNSNEHSKKQQKVYQVKYSPQNQLKSAYQQYKQSMQNDHELRLLSKWQMMAQQRQHTNKQNGHDSYFYYKYQHNNDQNYIRNKKQEYVDIVGPDESLILTKLTFWDRLKSKFM